MKKFIVVLVIFITVLSGCNKNEDLILPNEDFAEQGEGVYLQPQ